MPHNLLLTSIEEEGAGWGKGQKTTVLGFDTNSIDLCLVTCAVSREPRAESRLKHESINACYIIFQSINFRVTRFAYNNRRSCNSQPATRWDGPAPLTWPMNCRVNHMEWFYIHTHTRTHTAHTSSKEQQQEATIEYKCLIKWSMHKLGLNFWSLSVL